MNKLDTDKLRAEIENILVEVFEQGYWYSINFPEDEVKKISRKNIADDANEILALIKDKL